MDLNSACENKSILKLFVFLCENVDCNSDTYYFLTLTSKIYLKGI